MKNWDTKKHQEKLFYKKYAPGNLLARDEIIIFSNFRIISVALTDYADIKG